MTGIEAVLNVLVPISDLKLQKVSVDHMKQMGDESRVRLVNYMGKACGTNGGLLVTRQFCIICADRPVAPRPTWPCLAVGLVSSQAAGPGLLQLCHLCDIHKTGPTAVISWSRFHL